MYDVYYFKCLISSLFEMYDVYVLSPINYLINFPYNVFSIMKLGLLILLFILENVDNGEFQFVTRECRISKHKCDTIS